MSQTPCLYVNDGAVLDYLSSADKAMGEVVVIGSRPLIVSHVIDYSENPLGGLNAKGLWDIPQAAEIIAAGTKVYWDENGTPYGGTALSGCATATATGNKLLGTAAPVQTNHGTRAASATTGATDSYVRVLIDGESVNIATVAGSMTADDITGSDAALTIGGIAGSSGAGGTVVIVGGAGDTNAAGGLVSVTGGAGNGSGAGGAGSLVGGAGGATARGGAVAITGGAGGSTSGAPGAITITAGASAGTGNVAGAAASMTGGAGKGTQAGGAGSVVGGVGGATGAGGAMALTGGAGGSTSGTGGAVTVVGGAGSAGNANGGAVSLTGGAKNGSGTNGAVNIAADKACTVTIGYAGGKLILVGLPTSDPTNAGEVYSDSGTLKLSAGS